jgi:hypothetical protein
VEGEGIGGSLLIIMDGRRGGGERTLR